MNTLLRWSSAAVVLTLATVALAQSSGEQTPPAQEYPAQSIMFGVLTRFEMMRDSTGDVSPTSAGTAAESTSGQNQPVGGQFFIEGPPPGHLNSPPRRDAVRASIKQRYPDLAEAVDIDAATAEKLLDLLTEHQLSTLGTRALTPHASSDWMLKEADAEATRLDALRGLLGEEGSERYLEYSTTLRERKQVSTFDARLPSEHKLLPAQKEKMITLYQEDNARRREAHNPRHIGRYNPFFSGLQDEDLQRAAQLATIAANEEHLRAMPQSHRWFSQRAADFLTAPQLAALSQAHAEEENSLRKWIEKGRLEAGLHPAIPARPQLPTDEPPGPLTVQVKVDIELTVNRNEPMVVSHVVTNGETVAFEAGDGLLVEATPTLYGDDFLNVQLAYYEQRGTRKRRLTTAMSVRTLPPDGAPGDTDDFTVTSGSKTYAIKASVSVAAL